jgi:hypothetical protein
MLDLTVTLTGNEVEALLEQVRFRIEDNEEFAAAEELADDDFDYDAEVAFWKAIEQKLLA